MNGAHNQAYSRSLRSRSIIKQGGSMTEFYEFHDSNLLQIENREQKLILKIDAYRHTWPDGYEVNSGTGWVQPIEITIDLAVAEYTFTSFPVVIMDGCIKATSLEANPEDILCDEIPASLSGAVDVEICMEGYEKTTNEYKGMRIRGKSAAITHKGEAKFVEELPWGKKKDSTETKSKLIGVGQFDSGILDLATNKKYMEGFGE
ncbi:MAG: hypothetical protein ABR907_16690 [Terracidiphilus sp.]